MEINITQKEGSLFRLAPEEDWVMGLLQKERQVHQCLCKLEAFGIDTSGWPIDPGPLALSIFGFPNPDDTLLTWFYTTLNNDLEKLKNKQATPGELTMQWYAALRQQKSNQTADNT